MKNPLLPAIRAKKQHFYLLMKRCVAFMRTPEFLVLLNRIGEFSKRFVIPFSFILPISTLYLVYPQSFELVWKGRAPYLIFLWLLLLEVALAWKKIHSKPLSIAGIAITTVVPTYLISVFAFALNDEITELGKLVGVPYQEHGWLLGDWVLSIEYVVLTVCFLISILLTYRIDGLKIFSISLFFLGATTCFYMIDTFYPLGILGVLQGFVQVIASSVAGILNGMGHPTQVLSPERVQDLYKIDPKGMWGLNIHGFPNLILIAWGCAGVQSLFIYTFVILLFTKGAPISTKRKIIYVVIGAIGTFIVNILRIVSICLIGVQKGAEALRIFHEYYGELFFIVWIIAYLLIIIYGAQILTKMSVLLSKLKEPLVSYGRTS